MTQWIGQPAVGADDAHEKASGINFSTTHTTVRTFASTDPALRQNCGGRAAGCPIGPQHRVVSSVVAVTVGASRDDPELQIHCDNQADPPVFSSGANDVNARTRTTAYTTWSATGLGAGTHDTPDFSAALQEARQSSTPGDAACWLMDGLNNSTGNKLWLDSFEGTTPWTWTVDYALDSPADGRGGFVLRDARALVDKLTRGAYRGVSRVLRPEL